MISSKKSKKAFLCYLDYIKIMCLIHNAQQELVNNWALNKKKLNQVQGLLAKSFIFRIGAFLKLLKQKHSSLPGVDGVFLTANMLLREKINYVKWLKQNILNSAYKSFPLRRLYLKTTSNSNFFFLVPTIKDRLLQELVSFIFAPVVELYADRHNYGFRPFRAAKNALAYLYFSIKSIGITQVWFFQFSMENVISRVRYRWVFEQVLAPIKIKQLILQWIKFNTFSLFKKSYKGEIISFDSSVSLLLKNYIFNGIEKLLVQSIGFFKNFFVEMDHVWNLNFSFLRYVDKVLVIHKINKFLWFLIFPFVGSFFFLRGIFRFNAKIFNFLFSTTRLYFLDYEFFVSKKKLYKKNKTLKGALIIQPDRYCFKKFWKVISKIISKSHNVSVFILIVKLKTLLSLWCFYYNMGNCKKFRVVLKQRVFLALWQWSKKKHPKWGKNKLANFYLLAGSQKNKQNGMIQLSGWQFGHRLKKTNLSLQVFGKHRYTFFFLLKFVTYINLLPLYTYLLPKSSYKDIFFLKVNTLHLKHYLFLRLFKDGTLRFIRGNTI